MEKCITRTNRFKVKNTNALMEALAELIIANDESLQIIAEHEQGGFTFVFGCKAEIKGYAMDDGETDIYPFLDELVDIVADGDAIILQEIRYDKLKYMAAHAYIITSEKWDSIDFSECIFEKACEVTGNRNFRTDLEY